jgi:Lon protease-like protein
VELPLFPLKSVLFPGATLAVHVFEERYQRMTRWCLENDSPFGVLLIRSGSEVGEGADPFDVGTTAAIIRVQHLDDGRMNLVSLGRQRFRVSRRVRESPYVVAEVESLQSTEGEGEEAMGLADTVAALFAEYYRLYLAVSNQWSRQISMPSIPEELADFVAARLSVDLPAKQRLLEELSVRRRLEMELDTLSDAIRDLTTKVQAARAHRWRALGPMN